MNTITQRLPRPVKPRAEPALPLDTLPLVGGHPALLHWRLLQTLRDAPDYHALRVFNTEAACERVLLVSGPYVEPARPARFAGARAVATAVPRPAPEHSAAADEVAAAFARHAAIGQPLSHPNIVGTFETGRSKGRGFLVLERIEGRSLRTALATSWAPEPRLAIALCAQLADALACAHAQGAAHGDLSDEVLYIDGHEHLKIAGFGGWIDIGNEEPSAPVLPAVPGPSEAEQVRARIVDVQALAELFDALMQRCPGGADGRPPQTPAALRALLQRTLAGSAPVDARISGAAAPAAEAAVPGATEWLVELKRALDDPAVRARDPAVTLRASSATPAAKAPPATIRSAQTADESNGTAVREPLADARGPAIRVAQAPDQETEPSVPSHQAGVVVAGEARAARRDETAESCAPVAAAAPQRPVRDATEATMTPSPRRWRTAAALGAGAVAAALALVLVWVLQYGAPPLQAPGRTAVAAVAEPAPPVVEPAQPAAEPAAPASPPAAPVGSPDAAAAPAVPPQVVMPEQPRVATIVAAMPATPAPPAMTAMPAKPAEPASTAPAAPATNAAAARSQEPGYFTVALSPWGEVIVDGTSRGTSPPIRRIEVAPGTHQIDIVNGNDAPVRLTIHVDAGREVTYSHKF